MPSSAHPHKPFSARPPSSAPSRVLPYLAASPCSAVYGRTPPPSTKKARPKPSFFHFSYPSSIRLEWQVVCTRSCLRLCCRELWHSGLRSLLLWCSKTSNRLLWCKARSRWLWCKARHVITRNLKRRAFYNLPRANLSRPSLNAIAAHERTTLKIERNSYICTIHHEILKRRCQLVHLISKNCKNHLTWILIKCLKHKFLLFPSTA